MANKICLLDICSKEVENLNDKFCLEDSKSWAKHLQRQATSRFYKKCEDNDCELYFHHLAGFPKKKFCHDCMRNPKNNKLDKNLLKTYLCIDCENKLMTEQEINLLDKEKNKAISYKNISGGTSYDAEVEIACKTCGKFNLLVWRFAGSIINWYLSESYVSKNPKEYATEYFERYEEPEKMGFGEKSFLLFGLVAFLFVFWALFSLCGVWMDSWEGEILYDEGPTHPLNR